MIDRIIEVRKERIAGAKEEVPLSVLQECLAGLGPVRPFREALLGRGISLIAEVKKASPSRGYLGLDVSAAELAGRYERGGAAAVSVLTERDFFAGSNEDLVAVKAAVNLPVLRKDFIVDSYQLYESRVLGADAVLLIASLLPGDLLKEFLHLCSTLGLEALVETHTKEEIHAALAAGARTIGINNRDFSNFTTDLKRTLLLADEVSPGVVLVSESGIKTHADLKRLSAVRINAVLVGESLVKKTNQEQAVRELLGGGVNGQN